MSYQKKLILISTILVAFCFAINASAATESISIIREDGTGDYTSLSSWEADYGGIDFTGCDQGDIVCTDQTAIARIYGTWANPDTTSTIIDGWTTGPDNYIKIYTAATARHSGVWDDTKYRLVVGVYTSAPLDSREQYVRIDGLQVEQSEYFSAGGGYGIVVGVADGETHLSNNIIRYTPTHLANDAASGIRMNYVENVTYKIWNNIVYDFNLGISGRSMRNGANYLIYNNTSASNDRRDIEFSGYGGHDNTILRIKNNISQGAPNGYYLAVGGTTEYSNNISQGGTSPNTSLRNKTVVFEDANNKNYLLSSNDTNAREAGVDLSVDSDLAFMDDIKGETRLDNWDIGAGEYTGGLPIPIPDIIPPVVSNGSPSGSLPSDTTSTTLSVETDEDSNCKYDTLPSVSYSSMTNTFSTTGGTTHSTTILGLEPITNYAYYVKCEDLFVNSNTNDYEIVFSVASPPDSNPPSVPQNLVTTAVSPSQINLSWDASTDDIGVQGYKIYRNSVNINTTINTYYSDTGLCPGTPPACAYSYTVSAYDFADNDSGQSSSVPETTLNIGDVFMDVWAIGDSVKVRSDGNIIDPTYTPTHPNYKNTNEVWSSSSNTININGARNEYLSFQTVIGATAGDLTNVNVSVSNLTSSGNIIPSSNIELFKELFITTTQSSKRNNVLPPGEYPDALMPLYPDPSWIRTDAINPDTGALFTADDFAYFGVSQDKSQPIWADVYVPTGISDGVYTGTITITADNQDDKIINISLTVWDIDIPLKPSIPFDWRIYRLHINRLHNLGAVDWWANRDWESTYIDNGVEKEGVLKKYFQMAHKHRAQPTIDFTGPRTFNTDGTDYDWQTFDDTFGQALTGEAYNDGIPNMIWEIRPGGGSQGSPFYGNRPSNWQSMCGGCSSWAAWTQVRPLQEQMDDIMNISSLWANHFETKQWLDNFPFTYANDEPSMTNNEYNGIELYSRLVNEGSSGRINFMVTEQPFPLDPISGFYSFELEKAEGPDLFTREQAEIDETNPFYTNWVGNSPSLFDSERNIIDPDGSGVPLVIPNAKTKIDVWSPGGYTTMTENPYLNDLTDVYATGDKMWIYQGGGEPWTGNIEIDSELISARMWPWASWKYDIDGLFYWSVNYWNKAINAPNDPNLFDLAYTDPAHYAYSIYVWNGGGIIFYPGYSKGLDGPVSSVRMKSFRRGMLDYEYMQLLKDLGDPGFADSTVDSIVYEAYNSYAPNTTLTQVANAGESIINVDSSQYFTDTKFSTLKLIGQTPDEDEIIGVVDIDGTKKVIIIDRPLEYTHTANSVVAIMHDDFTRTDLTSQWTKNPQDWEDAKVSMALRILALQGGAPPPPPPSDSTPPAQIDTLTAITPTDTSVTLTWTEVGDDDMTGTVSNYNIGYSTTPITELNWDSPSIVTIVNGPVPVDAGIPRSTTVSGLDPETTYYFGIKASDGSNTSELSNIESATTQATIGPGDTTPPSDVDLKKGVITKDEVNLYWDESTDDVGVIGYEMRFRAGGAPISNSNWDTSTEVSGEPSPGQSLTMKFTDKIPGTTYSFGVRAYDIAGNMSDLDVNNISSVPVPVDITPPSTVDTLNANNITQTSMILTWEAPGDDGTTGTVSEYDIRYSTSVIGSDTDWDNATETDTEPDPLIFGTDQTMIVVGLVPDTTYWFALKSKDAAGNTSNVSNILQTKTQSLSSTPSSSDNDSSSSSGGGGGSFFDATPPSVPGNFEAGVDDIEVNLSWENPTESDFVYVLILRKEGEEPESKFDGDKVYSGRDEEFTDTDILKKDVKYYYAIYSYDHKPNYSQSAVTSIVIPSKRVITIVDTTPVVTTPVVTLPTTAFPTLTGPFGFGMKSDQVTLLQQMLATDPDIYPDGSITGYYGSLTVKAVQRFQVKYDLVTSGSPDTTGYGLAGPTTRAKMNEVFGILSASGGSLGGEMSSTTTATTTSGQAATTTDNQLLIEEIKRQIQLLQGMLVELLTQLAEILMGRVGNI